MERKTHAEAKASDERKGATTPNRNHRDINGLVLEPISVVIIFTNSLISASRR